MRNVITKPIRSGLGAEGNYPAAREALPHDRLRFSKNAEFSIQMKLPRFFQGTFSARCTGRWSPRAHQLFTALLAPI